MSLPRTDEEAKESKIINIARQLARKHMLLELANIYQHHPGYFQGAVEVSATQLLTYLQDNASPKTIADFLFEPNIFMIGEKYSIWDLKNPIGLKVLIYIAYHHDSEFLAIVTEFLAIVSEIIKKAYPVIGTMNVKNLAAKLLICEGEDCNALHYDDLERIIKCLALLLELFKIVNAASTDYGKLFETISMSERMRIGDSGFRESNLIVSDYIELLKHSNLAALQNLRFRAHYSMYNEYSEGTYLDAVIKFVVHRNKCNLFQILLDKMGSYELGVLLLQVQNEHYVNFPMFSKKPSSFFELYPGKFLESDNPEHAKFNDYVLLLIDPVNFFKKNPKECLELIMQLTRYPIESLQHNPNIYKVLSKIINDHAKDHANEEYLQILYYINAKVKYIKFLEVQNKAEQAQMATSSALPTASKAKKSFSEKELKAIEHLDDHDTAVKLWLDIHPEKLPTEIVISSDITLIGFVLLGAINSPAFYEFDSTDIQIRALQYFYQAALRNDSAAIKQLGIMANTLGIPDEKQENKREPKPLGFFRVDKPAKEEPLSLDEEAPATQFEAIHTQYIALLKKLTSQHKAASAPPKVEDKKEQAFISRETKTEPPKIPLIGLGGFIQPALPATQLLHQAMPHLPQWYNFADKGFALQCNDKNEAKLLSEKLAKIFADSKINVSHQVRPSGLAFVIINLSDTNQLPDILNSRKEELAKIKIDYKGPTVNPMS